MSYENNLEAHLDAKQMESCLVIGKESTLDEMLENMTCPNCHANEGEYIPRDACEGEAYWHCIGCDHMWGFE